MSSPSSSHSPSEELGLSHSLGFFGSGEVSRELSEDGCYENEDPRKLLVLLARPVCSVSLWEPVWC